MIKPEDVLDISLENLLGNSMDYEKIRNMVSTYLFSRYPRRREYSLRKLRHELGFPYSVEMIEHEGIKYAYIGAKGRYILVARYDDSKPVFEEIPTQEDIKKWDQN